MLVEKHEPVNLFTLVPLERDPVLDQLDQLLDEDQLFQAVKADLARRHPHTLTRGRHLTLRGSDDQRRALCDAGGPADL